MSKRVFDRSTSYESRVIDMHTGKPVPAETKPMICDRIRHYREELGIEETERKEYNAAFQQIAPYRYKYNEEDEKTKYIDTMQ